MNIDRLIRHYTSAIFAAIFIVFVTSGCATNRTKIDNDTAGTFSVYGNWCGPDHPKYSINPPQPIDRLDASCMRHDICYTEKGYLNCDCDKTLNQEIKKDLIDHAYSREASGYAKNIHRYFANSPCDGKAEAKTAPTRILQNTYQKAKRGLTNLYRKIIPGSDDNITETPDSNNSDNADAAENKP